MEREVKGLDLGVATVAHELKAPLSLMRQLALALEIEDDSDEVKKMSEKMVATSERALRQVNDLTKVMRLEDGLFEMEPVNPRQVCEEVAKEMTTLFRYNRKEMKVKYRNKSTLVLGNRDLLRGVVSNFCLNALNYGSDEAPSELFIRDVKGGMVRLGVRDYGPAVPTAVWKEIRNGTVKRPVEMAMRPGSSGLGLYIVSRFTDYMCGRFGLIRHRDGTTFYVDLPVSQQLSWLSDY